MFLRSKEELCNLFCENNSNLSWETVNSYLMDAIESNVNFHSISIEGLVEVQQILEGNICINLKKTKFQCFCR